MSSSYEHNEQAAFCGCMDGREALTAAMLGEYASACRDNGQVFRYFWGGGPLLFLLPATQQFVTDQVKLGCQVHAFSQFIGYLHMGCGAYAALAGKTFETREDELAAKWADADDITAYIEGLGLGITAHIGIIDVDGTILERQPALASA